MFATGETVVDLAKWIIEDTSLVPFINKNTPENISNARTD